MIDALLRLFEDGIDCCRFYRTITSRCADQSDVDLTEFGQIEDNHSPEESIEGLNHSQSAAVRSCEVPFSLIWGPPGLRRFLNSETSLF